MDPALTIGKLASACSSRLRRGSAPGRAGPASPSLNQDF